MRLTFIISLLFLSQTLFAQGDSFEKFFVGDLAQNASQDISVRDSLFLWQERILLQTDKKTVRPKDVLFFKAYILTGPNQLRVSASEVLKVELLDKQGNLIKSQNHKIRAGISNGSFEIPKKIKHGTYYLRAYTRWLLNYGSEQFPIQKLQVGDFVSEKKEDKVEFYPEGGSLVAGLNNRLIMTMGENLAGKFQIIDSQNQLVSDVMNYGDNMYSALFIPVIGNQYFLRLSTGRKLQLPSIKDYGYTLQVNNINDGFFDLRIQKSPELFKEKLWIRGQSSGKKYLETEVNFKGESSIDIQIPKKGLPRGIFQIALVDELDHIWAERRLQIDAPELRIQIEPLENKLSGETHQAFSIKVTDGEGKPVVTELGVTLFGEKRVAGLGDDKSPSLYENNSRSQRYINDLLVLTNQLPGHFVKASDEEFPNEIYYDFQNGLEFYGQAYDLDNKLLTNSDLQILITNEDDNVAQEVRTDSYGMFRLTGLQMVGEATMIFRRVSEAEDAKSKMVKVSPYTYEIPSFKVTSVEKDKNSAKFQKRQSAVPKLPVKKFNSLIEEEGVIALEGVTLVEEKVKRASNPSVYGIEPDRKVIQDPKRPKTIPQLFIDIPGFQVTNLGGLNPALIRPMSMGVGPTLWVIDGFPLSQSSIRPLGAQTISKLREAMDLISFTDVERIEILSGANASIYGSRASGGVILIYTRTASFVDYFARKDAQLTYKGFHKSFDFKTYFKSQKENKRNQGFNQTLYWNPTLMTDKNGEAIIEVELPKRALKIKFNALAITPEGKIGKFSRTF